MKTALTALAVIATATTAMADDDGFAVIDKDSVDGGKIEIITQIGGEFTLSLVNCIPMKSAVLDTADSPSELDDDDHHEAELIEIVRGTIAHDIATAACADGQAPGQL